MRILVSLAVGFLVYASAAQAQGLESPICTPTLAPRATGGRQVADDGFNPEIRDPAFPSGKGPTVLLDEGHRGFTVSGNYSAFARLLRRDGFVVEPLRTRLTREALAPARILVSVNALSSRKPGDPYIPSSSAFEVDEIEAVKDWVSSGGSLLLVADHMPAGGAAAELGRAFGLLLTDGYATDASCGADEFLFQRVDGTLRDHPITRGRSAAERVSAVRTFTGQAFRSVAEGTSPLLVLAPQTVLLLPTEPWRFTDQTPRVPAEGMLQGAALTHGSGRVAAFGEAAMFSAQVSGAERRPMGMNVPTASENAQFLLNVVHWLAGLLPAQ
jgi:hypothetical protein